ncbi:MAG: sodium:proton antiporter [Aliidongia sp.]
MALGLVLFTVVGAGFFIHWMIPAVPLAVAFALAAILSPTDAVAVAAIAKRTPFPRRLMHILEGEALLNDASGLVCMRFAVAAALTGSFSIVEASATFLWLASGGIAVGAAVALTANTAKDWIARHFGEETGSQILISLLIPFAAYLLASRLQVSGILAAVVAGIAMNHEERTGHASPVTRIRRAAVWDAVQFASNGVIFVLLGHQLPTIAVGAAQAVDETGHQRGLWLLAYVAAITAALVMLRGSWVWITCACSGSGCLVALRMLGRAAGALRRRHRLPAPAEQ